MKSELICLDINYLLRACLLNSPESKRIETWINQGHRLCAASSSWLEFLASPVEEQVKEGMRQLLLGGVLAFGEEEARLARGLGAGLNRHSITASCAIKAQAILASPEIEAYRPFVEQGLKLMKA
jgi:hypothetical protein